jgi:nitrous oxidase accessory protein
MCISSAVQINIDEKEKVLTTYDTIYVDDDFDYTTPGWQETHFDNISAGLDAVNDGGTVYVYEGKYYENLVIDKPINLIGEDKYITTIDGNLFETPVKIVADNVRITGFTIQRSGQDFGSDDSGIYVRSNLNVIHDNIILDNLFGINLYYSSNNAITNNTIGPDNYEGILLDESSMNYITGNAISENQYVGIELQYNSNYNIISNNTITLHYQGCGIYLQYIFLHPEQGCNNNIIEYNYLVYNSLGIGVRRFCNNNIVSNNIIDTGNDGLYINSIDNVISNNTITNHYENGISIYEHSHNNIIFNNNISLNYDYGIYSKGSYNIIYHNNFINNEQNAYDWGSNIWNGIYPNGGNYWSDYTGDDFFKGPNQNIPGKDGIGDKPYLIQDNNKDKYPLMKPWPEFHNDQATPQSMPQQGSQEYQSQQLQFFSQQIMTLFLQSVSV